MNWRQTIRRISIVTIIGLSADLLGLTSFFTGNGSISDYFKDNNADSLTTRTNPSISEPFQNGNHQKRIDAHQIDDKKISTIVRDSIQKATQEGLSTVAIDSPQNISTVDEVENYQTITDNDIQPNNNVADLSELPPPKGYGKLAIQSYCDYADNWVTIRIYLPNGGNVDDQFPAQFDPAKKRKTTYTVDLLPGKYNVVLNYNTSGYKIGKDTITVEVKENETRLYTHRKINPYGQGKGRIFFVPKGSKRIFIKVDENNIGEISPANKRGIFFDLPEGLYKCLIVNSDSSALADNIITYEVHLRAGELEVIPINNYY